jgi:hypothetical protein
VEIKVGDIYIRHSDGQICRVKWIDRTTLVLESDNERHVRLTNIFALEKAYRKREFQPTR